MNDTILRGCAALAALSMLIMGCAQEPSYRSDGRSDSRSTANQRIGGNPAKPVPPIPPSPATGNRPPGPEY